MENEIKEIKKELGAIRERNERVEGDKAWEVSGFRVGSITVGMYIIASAALYAIGNDFPLRNALIPAIGYLLSTQSLPFIKRNWIARYRSNKSKI